MQSDAIQRGNISEAAADTVRAMIVDGRLAAGDRINEVRLAQQLGVSRTPLREALSGLAAEGALSSVPRIGYFVRPLTLDEFEQIYDIRPLLDPEALRLAGVPDEKRIAGLEKLNADLAPFEKVKKFALLDRELSQEAGELTPTLKVRRRIVGQKFADIIEGLYPVA